MASLSVMNLSLALSLIASLIVVTYAARSEPIIRRCHVPTVLQNHGLPAGLFPSSVKSCTLTSEPKGKRLTIKLKIPENSETCKAVTASLIGVTNTVECQSQISAIISPGSLTDIKGVKAIIDFMTFPHTRKEYNVTGVETQLFGTALRFVSNENGKTDQSPWFGSIIFSKPQPCQKTSTDGCDVPTVLQNHGLPAGLFPNSVESCTLTREPNKGKRLTIKLKIPENSETCNVTASLIGVTNTVECQSQISAIISPGSLTDIEGVKVTIDDPIFTHSHEVYKVTGVETQLFGFFLRFVSNENGGTVHSPWFGSFMFSTPLPCQKTSTDGYYYGNVYDQTLLRLVV